MSNAIETRAGGQLFRSRLEARWAMFFDAIGWRWTYEPFDGDYYIPDFLIHGEKPFLVEVKPYATYEECRAELGRVNAKLPDWTDGILVVGCDPQLPDPWFPNTEWQVAGAMRRNGFIEEQSQWWFCKECRAWRIKGRFDTVMEYNLDGEPIDPVVMHPCGHFLAGNPFVIASDDNISLLWRDAGNQARWTPKVDDEIPENSVLGRVMRGKSMWE